MCCALAVRTLLLLVCTSARAVSQAADCERCALTPTTAAPLEVAHGELLAAEVRVATALALPPGVQSERSLAGFAARACPSEDASARCTALAIESVRPTDAHSLVYRMRARVPAGLGAGRYDLELRFPGGSASIAAGLMVRAPDAAERSRPSEAPAHVPASCTISTAAAPRTQGGLLLVLLSWKLAAGLRGRVTRWNSASRTSVSRGL